MFPNNSHFYCYLFPNRIKMYLSFNNIDYINEITKKIVLFYTDIHVFK